MVSYTFTHGIDSIAPALSCTTGLRNTAARNSVGCRHTKPLLAQLGPMYCSTVYVCTGLMWERRSGRQRTALAPLAVYLIEVAEQRTFVGDGGANSHLGLSENACHVVGSIILPGDSM